MTWNEKVINMNLILRFHHLKHAMRSSTVVAQPLPRRAGLRSNTKHFWSLIGSWPTNMRSGHFTHAHIDTHHHSQMCRHSCKHTHPLMQTHTLMFTDTKTITNSLKQTHTCIHTHTDTCIHTNTHVHQTNTNPYPWEGRLWSDTSQQEALSPAQCTAKSQYHPMSGISCVLLLREYICLGWHTSTYCHMKQWLSWHCKPHTTSPFSLCRGHRNWYLLNDWKQLPTKWLWSKNLNKVIFVVRFCVSVAPKDVQLTCWKPSLWGQKKETDSRLMGRCLIMAIPRSTWMLFRCRFLLCNYKMWSQNRWSSDLSSERAFTKPLDWLHVKVVLLVLYSLQLDMTVLLTY